MEKRARKAVINGMSELCHYLLFVRNMQYQMKMRGEKGNIGGVVL